MSNEWDANQAIVFFPKQHLLHTDNPAIFNNSNNSKGVEIKQKLSVSRQQRLFLALDGLIQIIYIICLWVNLVIALFVSAVPLSAPSKKIHSEPSLQQIFKNSFI